MIDEATLAALRERVHARPDVRQALAAEHDAAILGWRLSPGQRVSWWCVPRGGYGYGYPVDGEVVRVGAARVTIRVRRVTGELVERSVAPERLRAKGDA